MSLRKETEQHSHIQTAGPHTHFSSSPSLFSLYSPPPLKITIYYDLFLVILCCLTFDYQMGEDYSVAPQW